MSEKCPSLPVIKKGPKLPRRGSQLSVGMADAAFVADNHGAWLKFAPCSMSDEQWEVAAKTPEAVLSHRSCPWGGHLIKIDSKTLAELHSSWILVMFDCQSA